MTIQGKKTSQLTPAQQLQDSDKLPGARSNMNYSWDGAKIKAAVIGEFANKDVLDLFSESNGNLYFDGVQINAGHFPGVTVLNSSTVIEAADMGKVFILNPISADIEIAVPATSALSGKPGMSTVFIRTADNDHNATIIGQGGTLLGKHSNIILSWAGDAISLAVTNLSPAQYGLQFSRGFEKHTIKAESVKDIEKAQARFSAHGSGVVEIAQDITLASDLTIAGSNFHIKSAAGEKHTINLNNNIIITSCPGNIVEDLIINGDKANLDGNNQEVMQILAGTAGKNHSVSFKNVDLLNVSGKTAATDGTIEYKAGSGVTDPLGKLTVIFFQSQFYTGHQEADEAHGANLKVSDECSEVLIQALHMLYVKIELNKFRLSVTGSPDTLAIGNGTAEFHQDDFDEVRILRDIDTSMWKSEGEPAKTKLKTAQDIDAQSQKITALLAGTEDGDAVNKEQLDEVEDLIMNKRFKIFDNITERDAYVAGDEAFLCVVVDASADPDVDSGGALYAWKPGDPTGEYRLLAKYGELDMAVLIAAAIDGVAGKATLADADKIGIVDSADGNTLKKQTWAERKTQLEGLYAGTATPQDHGTAAVGNSDKYARENHVHNSDNTDTIYEHPATHPQSIIDESATVEGTPIDASRFHFWDTVNSVWKVITWTNIKAELKTYFESVWDFGHNIFSQLDTTALTQRAKLRFKGFLKASDDAVEGETVVEIDETKTEAIEFVQQYRLTLEDKSHANGTAATAVASVDNAIETNETFVINEHANRYCILTYTDAANEREILKIASNTDTTDASELHFTADRQHTGATFDTGITYIVLEHHDFQGDETPLIEGDITQHDYVVILPALIAENDSLELRVYTNDEAAATGDKRIWILPDGVQTVAGESGYSIADKAAGLLFYQNFAKTNWDLFSKYVKA